MSSMGKLAIGDGTVHLEKLLVSLRITSFHGQGAISPEAEGA